jgi:muramidase (phage lysozyme)
MSNRKAFLDMLAYSEGTSTVPESDNGYNVIVGGKLFHDYADHPRVVVDLGHGLKSTAAGRYQILSRYWDVYRKQLNLSDFSPLSQDAVAIQLIRECHALEDIDAGRFEEAVHKVRSRWASLPGAGYGQHEQKLDVLKEVYQKAGGTFV